MDIYLSDHSDDDFIPILAAIIATEDAEPPKKKKRTHRWWVRPWIGERDVQTENNTIFKLQKQLREVSN